jgi:hypothetical protein
MTNLALLFVDELTPTQRNEATAKVSYNEPQQGQINNNGSLHKRSISL